MRRFGLAVILVLALGAAACSDGGGNDAVSDEGKEYADAFAASMLVGADGEVSEDQAQCTGEALVNAIGIKQLKESTTPEEIRGSGDDPFGADPFDNIDIDAALASDLYDSMNKCIDFKSLMVEEIAADDEISPAAAECIDEKLDDDAVKAMMTAEMQGQDFEDDSEVAGELMAPLMSCFMM